VGRGGGGRERKRQKIERRRGEEEEEGKRRLVKKGKGQGSMATEKMASSNARVSYWMEKHGGFLAALVCGGSQRGPDLVIAAP
jgi:hypothetical protein